MNRSFVLGLLEKLGQFVHPRFSGKAQWPWQCFGSKNPNYGTFARRHFSMDPGTLGRGFADSVRLKGK